MDSLSYVLAVDDEKANTFLLNIFFAEELGSACRFNAVSDVESGIRLLDTLHQKGQDFPDLILLDVNMPGKDGFDFLYTFHKREYHANYHTDIILLSSTISPQIMDEAQQYDSVVGIEEKSMEMDHLKILLHKYFPSS